MAKIQHPESLNPLQQFRQAGSIFRNTSRASNPAWYSSALDLDFQLHIRPDGPNVYCTYYNRKKSEWSNGPSLTEDMLHNEEQIEKFAEGLLKETSSNRANAIGVILHVADEFAITELKQELDNPGDIPDLRKAAINDPISIVEDSSIKVDEASWRVVPYTAGGDLIATTVTITSQYAPFLALLRKAGERANFPVITHALSAPLVAIMGLPKFLKANPQKPFVTILQYPWFTVLAFFNEHADLKLIRTLQHRGVRTASNFRNALFTTSASLEFLDPDLYILPLGEDIDLALEPNLKGHFQNSKVELLSTKTIDNLPDWAPEIAIVADSSGNKGAVDSETFTSFREDGWATQDFLPTPKKVAEIYPTKTEMNMLRIARIARVAIILLTLVGLGYFAMGVLNYVRKPEWSFDSSQASKVQARVAKLTTERRKIDHWSNLMSDRSKAWANMESLARMFPPDSGMLIKKYSFTAKPDAARGQQKVGFIKAWTISGFARNEAVQRYLNKLNTREGIDAHFEEVAKATGNSVFETNPPNSNRSITVNIRTRENNSFSPVPIDEAMITDETTYPFTFELTIKQRFESNDPLAITVPKVP